MTNILFLHAGAEMYGADKVMLDLIKNLNPSKYTALVILPCSGVLVDALIKEKINVKIIPYPVLRRKYFNPRGMVQYVIDFIRYSKEIYKIAIKNRIDLIHTNTAATLEGCYVSRKLKVPHIWSIHEIIVKPKFVFKMTSKLISKFSNITITDSQAVKNHLLASNYFNNEDIKVIYNGVDSDFFSPQNDCNYLYKEWDIPIQSQVIGMIGRVNSWKGQSDFLKSANVLLSKFSDLYVVLVGSAFEGEEWREDELKKEIEKSPYSNRIIYQGYRTDSKGIYKLFDIFVLPSTNPDPLPTVVLEAMSTGKPIVGYMHGGVCEMVKEGYNGLLAIVNDPLDLASKLELLLNNEDKVFQMGMNSRTRLLKDFSIEAYVSNYENEYECLIKTS